jgi:hypothetical protein
VSKLGDQLMTAPIPASTAGKTRAMALARAAVIEAPPQFSAETKANWPGGRVRLALAVILVALLVATPPGRAAVSWAADLVGIGDVGGSPSVEQTFPNAPAAGDQVVIGNGTAPDGTRYEMAAYESKNHGTCLAFEFPDLGTQRTSGVCLDGQASRGFNSSNATFPNAESPQPDTGWVDGSLSNDVTRVLVRSTVRGGEPVESEAQIASLEGELQDQIGATQVLKFFVAFLPHDLSQADLDSGESEAEIIAYDENGQEIDRRRLGITEQERQQQEELSRQVRSVCLNLRSEGHELPSWCNQVLK